MTEVAKAYGGALFELSRESGILDELLQQTQVVKAAFADNVQFIKLLAAPMLRIEQRIAILNEVFTDKAHPYLLNFLKLLTENGTISEFGQCAAEFRRLYNETNGIEEVTVVTAVAMQDTQKERLAEKLAAMTGKRIVLENKVDAAVLGGVRLELDGLELNGSIKHRLDALRQNLLAVIA